MIKLRGKNVNKFVVNSKFLKFPQIHYTDIDFIYLQSEIPRRFLISETPMKQICENDEAISCKNSIECIKEDGIPICVCQKGFIGPSCQFCWFTIIF